MENTMLIVDDMEMNREILKLLFHGEYGILEANDGGEALEILERCQGNIDIVLLDLIMPGITGQMVLEQMRNDENLKNIPVVVITSSEEMGDQIKAFENGAADYVTKPFIPEIVVSRVNNVMASHRRMLLVELEAQKLKVKSELDEMTGVYNKTTSELVINEMLCTSKHNIDVLMVIDIDNFKAVNDTSGHLAGDHVIKIIADLISSLFRKTDVVGRIGGDEFVVLMADVPSMDIVRTKVNELIQIMRYKPNLTIPEYVTLSIGVASNNGEQTTYSSLFKKADEALYQAKQGGKAQYREHGIEVSNLDKDERPAVLLLSNNRGVCSVVNALVPIQLRVIEVLNIDDLKALPKEDTEKIVAFYVDVADEKDGLSFWEKFKTFDFVQMENVYAICREGDIIQYMNALKNGVADMLTTPIDADAFKRRTLRQLEKLNLK